jgi:hypothetical protein
VTAYASPARRFRWWLLDVLSQGLDLSEPVVRMVGRNRVTGRGRVVRSTRGLRYVPDEREVDE